MLSKKLFFIILLASLLQPVLAETDNELTSWNTINLDIPLKFISPNLFLRESASTRFDNEFASMDVQLLRSTINYKQGDAMYSFGYDWFKLFDVSQYVENRLWQQFYYEHDTPLEDLNLFHRVRVDERMFEGVDTQVRARYQIGVNYALKKDLTLVFADELFVNLNQTARAEQGIEQNRVYLGLIKRLNKKASIAGGYQLQHFFLDRDLINHGLILNLNLSL